MPGLNGSKKANSRAEVCPHRLSTGYPQRQSDAAVARYRSPQLPRRTSPALCGVYESAWRTPAPLGRRVRRRPAGAGLRSTPHKSPHPPENRGGVWQRTTTARRLLF